MVKKIKVSDKPPVSDKTIKGMSLNIDDRSWIKRSLDDLGETWNSTFELNIAELTEALVKKIDAKFLEQNQELERIKDSIQAVNDKLEEIEKRLDDGDIAIALLKHFASTGQTIFRLGSGILVGIIVGFIIHYFI